MYLESKEKLLFDIWISHMFRKGLYVQGNKALHSVNPLKGMGYGKYIHLKCY